LIWVGGLVTTYGAGMAVPDWPNTYGWNMFAYPPSAWLYGGFDLMVEHGHRLLGTLAGLFAIGLLIAAVAWDKRSWFKWWCAFVLAAVIAQGLLGGFRVRLDERTFAMIHGCTAQLFLAIATATAVMSSKWWFSIGKLLAGMKRPASRALARTATGLLMFAYLQVIAGAQLRHVTGGIEPSAFMGLVHIHLALAVVVALSSLLVALFAALNRHLIGGVKWPALFILVVVLLQICLGIGTWLVNYAIPWQEVTPELAGYTIISKGYWESVLVTSHVATGALIISLATVMCVRAWRSRSVVSSSEIGSPTTSTG
jgi:cytochrome c oxidase assembly protein subunit 15